ncbi:MAG: hypothetical protein KAV99_03550 [Candidatus Latescibacteria bacterium]|nr:hypothetical protein [Candidatus Latescibacterota bacterium]
MPNFATLDEEAEFWEDHSLTEYMDELEDVEFEVDAMPEDTVLTIQVSPHLIRRLKEVAKIQGTSLRGLLRKWVESLGDS